MMANTWQGAFPVHNDLLDGYERTSPVGRFPSNGHGLVDITGNVWEWTVEDYTSSHAGAAATAARAGSHEGRHLLWAARPVPSRAGLLCAGSSTGDEGDQSRIAPLAPNYCLRYRPAARQSQTIDTSTSHLGFRCLTRL